MTTNSDIFAGLMMETPLTVTSILRRAAQCFPEKEIVTRFGDGSIHRTNYGELYQRVIRLINALQELGVGPGDRVVSFAWNTHRHLELYFAVPCMGAVLHTGNIRYSAEQITYVVNHAENKVVFVDRSLAGTLAPLQSDLKTVNHYVIMNDLGDVPSAMPSPALDYEELLANTSSIPNFPEIDERAAAGLCYTSGTTGDPKGVLYSHRSLYLHAMGCCMTDSMAISEREVVLPIVPLFHANGWGLPYACGLAGAKVVLPGSQVFGEPLARLFEQERVTFSAGVPTVWNLLYQHLKQHTYDLSALKVIVSGGSAVPQILMENYERDFGIILRCVWGMTEMSPVGSIGHLKGEMESWDYADQIRFRIKQGMPVPGVEMRIIGEQGEELAWDGKQAGELEVRGPWVARSYYADPSKSTAFTADGWLRTGDIATIDSYGFMEITDRKKDVIKSRGEWISSVDMENAVMAHPKVLEAAVVAKPDPLRDEIPAVFVVARNTDDPPTPRDVFDLLKTRFAHWQLPHPSNIHLVASLPKTSVGKMDKKVLRQQLEEEAKH
jgi:fatty-acyl-CoA synthase